MSRSIEISEMLSEQKVEEQTDVTLQDHLSRVYTSAQNLEDAAKKARVIIESAQSLIRRNQLDVPYCANKLYDLQKKIDSLSDDFKSSIEDFYTDRYVTK